MTKPRFSYDQLLEYSKQLFQDNPHLDKLYATHDGEFFGERSKSDATNYARQTEQELVLIERVKSDGLTTNVFEPEDPMTRDVAALMLALNCTEDKARQLIDEHMGNAAAAKLAAQQPDPDVAPVK